MQIKMYLSEIENVLVSVRYIAYSSPSLNINCILLNSSLIYSLIKSCALHCMKQWTAEIPKNL